MRLAEISMRSEDGEIVFVVRPAKGVSSDVVLERLMVLQRADDAAREKSSAKRVFDPQTDMAIGADYRAGMSLPELVEKYGGSQRSISGALDRCGVARRSVSEAQKLKHAGRNSRSVRVSAKPPAPPPRPKSGPKTQPANALPDKRNAQLATGPGNKRNMAIARAPSVAGREAEALAARDAAIVARYVALESPEVIAPDFGVSPRTVRDVVERAGVRLRTRSEATALAHARRRGDPLELGEPAPRPVERERIHIAVPKNAPRQRVTLAQMVAREPKPEKRKGKEVVRELMSHGVRAKRQKQIAEAFPLTSDNASDAVKRYFAAGGKITVIESPKFQGDQRPSMGHGSKRSTGGLGS